MSKGYVYILTHQFMPGLVKIGMTTRTVEARANELYQTGVPGPFNVSHSVLSPDCAGLELWVHERLDPSRLYPDREFFKMEVADAIQVLNDCHREQVEIWLSDFLPEHSIAEPGFEVDPSYPHIMATHIDAHPTEIVDAYGYLMPDEMLPAIQRRADHMSGKKKMDWLRPAPTKGPVQ